MEPTERPVSAARSEGTFREAKALAEKHGLQLTKPSDGCYQLRGPGKDGFIINLYPRRKGFTPRIYHDKNRPGPFLDLPTHWTLYQAVNATVKAMEAQRGKTGSA